MKHPARFSEKLLHRFNRIPFRRSGALYLSLILVLVILALTLALLARLLEWLDVPPNTVLATAAETGVGCYTTGYIVRQEQVLCSDCPMTTLAVGEGQKVAAAQTVAVGYTTNDARQKQLQITQLEARVKQLQYAGGGMAVYDQAAMDAEVRQQLTETAELLARGDLISVSDYATELKGLILRGSADQETLDALGARIEDLQTNVNSLRRQITGQTEIVGAGTAGYFSGTVDGYESVLTPKRLDVLSVTELEQITPDAQPAGVVGKIIEGDTWYYVTTVTTEYAEQLTVGSSVTVSFAHNLARDLRMQVSRISPEENGKCVVVFSANHFIQDVTMMRSQSADVVLQTYQGLRVPKEAVRVREDGAVGVFILETTDAKWKPVNILYDSGENYIVKLDKSSTGHLWPGDEILVDTKDLYDGKVVLQQ